MKQLSFGIDFGTTNSLASVIVGERALSMTDISTGRPHPSVIWYRGAEIVVGHDAKQHLDTTVDGAPLGFIRSPKMRLRREGPIFVDGRPIDPSDAVSNVLKHLKMDARIPRDAATGYELKRAVCTIPVDFGGRERRALRESALKAGIGVIQFVHEPVAALYGYLRAQPDYRRELANLEGRAVLVFDWGGGTLDLTVCKIQGGSIIQIASLGDNEVGGDEFDAKLCNFVRRRHATAYGLEDIVSLEQPGMAAKLLNQCELAKIELSRKGAKKHSVFIRNFLKVEGPAQHLNVTITRKELEEISFGIVSRGLRRINELLERARLTIHDIDRCLATGGMVNMPAIREGLVESFVGRVPELPNSDRIIAEGAAWIAHDDLRLTLAKPIELLMADTSGTGTYYPLVPAGLPLPLENQVVPAANTRLFCIDPREGTAILEFAKPIRIGAALPTDPRQTLYVLDVPVDSNAAPFVERIECHLQIDHNYVVTAKLRSTGRRAEAEAQFHDLDFGLSLPVGGDAKSGPTAVAKGSNRKDAVRIVPSASSNVAQRVNVAIDDAGASGTLWKLVPGDIVTKWRPDHFDIRTSEASDRQREERAFYLTCSHCRRTISQIIADGPVEECRGRRCGSRMSTNAPLGEGTSDRAEADNRRLR